MHLQFLCLATLLLGSLQLVKGLSPLQHITEKQTEPSDYADHFWTKLTPIENNTAYPYYTGFFPGESRLLQRGYAKENGLKAWPVDTILEKDLAITLRDGTVIYADVYRAAGGNNLSVILCWSPYGKGDTVQAWRNINSTLLNNWGASYAEFSGYGKFEGGDPATWIERGYALVDVDARGAINSEGDIVFWQKQEAEDIYDTLSWIENRDWCSGNVGMFGNSWLAVAQVNFASRFKHRALKAIAPWEALNDAYLHMFRTGGRPTNIVFAENFMAQRAGPGYIENLTAAAFAHPLYDEFWEKRKQHVENISIPMYQTISWNSLSGHLLGALDTYNRVPGKKHWMRISDSFETQYSSDPDWLDELQKFYDFYLKGIDNSWESTPNLRVSLLNYRSSIIPESIVDRVVPSGEFPPPEVKNVRFYLGQNGTNLKNGTLTSSPSGEQTALSYNSTSWTDELAFTHFFENYTEVLGYPWASLWMSCNESTNMDIVVQIRKVNVFGEPLTSTNWFLPGLIDSYPSSDAVIYIGTKGALRANHSISLLPKKSPDDYPVYSHKKDESIPKGAIVELQIPIWPMGTVFGAGEGFELRIAGRDLLASVFGAFEDTSGDMEPNYNEGNHVVHVGEKYPSFISMPLLTS